MIRALLLPALMLIGFQQNSFAGGMSPLLGGPMVDVGDTAPCITLDHLNYNGTETQRSTCKGEHSNQNLVLTFFATWCEYCVADLPTFTKIATKFKGQAIFRLIGVDKEADVRSYFKGKDFSSFEIGFDPDLKTVDAFNLEGTPTLVVIGPDGKVKYVYVGEIVPADEQTVENNILK